jgi:hypothetical protein
LLARDPHHVWSRTPQGLELDYEVPGVLTEWAPGSDGSWLGKVTFLLRTRDHEWSVEVTQYVPAHLMRSWWRRPSSFR